MSRFKVGDKVIVSKPETGMELYLGMIGAIISITEHVEFGIRCKILKGKSEGCELQVAPREIRKAYYKKFRLKPERLPA